MVGWSELESLLLERLPPDTVVRVRGGWGQSH
jgi:hypothetical protein